MEVSGVVFRQFSCFSGAGIDTQSSKLPFSCLSFEPGNVFSGELRIVGSGGRMSSVKAGKGNLGFVDNGNLEYYVSPKVGMKKEKEKEKKKSEKEIVKKKLKLLKGLSKDLLAFSSIGFGVDGDEGLISEVKGKKISEATEVLLSQLKQLKKEEKEVKRKRKEEKAKLKASRSESLSNSLESSDSESRDVVNMNLLRNGAIFEMEINRPEISNSPVSVMQGQGIMLMEAIKEQNMLDFGGESCDNIRSSISSISENSVMVTALANKIEVCMGGKCKKLGAPALMEEFEKRVGVEGAVVGCKCMGKCRDGPNVRVQCNGEVPERNDGSLEVYATNNPLCIGVGLEDVGVIIGNFFGQGSKESSLVAA